MRKFIAGLLVGLILAIGVPAFAQSGIKLFVNGVEVKTDVPPQTINGTLMVPARALAESLGANVAWDSKENKVTVTTGTTSSNVFNKDINAALDYVDKGLLSNFTYSSPLIMAKISQNLSDDINQLREMDMSFEERNPWNKKLLAANTMLLHYEYAVGNREVPKAFEHSYGLFMKYRGELLELLKN